ncbi:hypothetical protein AA103196_0573 [Ameyamaea chiangmaiensis NBRC 103196]|uniref:Uncharacterized protein n=1 Tax=Ameyamaea chiangmaiensis TaxID=442969 RepID=A0A850P758_9PROT|nr:hypothetical protein [Ameyamaea chiangmaiensis]MBS4074968.1 hypothetical protein [Ameyamaea chiangmaiensis]NVN39734.1 hypothetical protein [Ameyamaea chiangmaiensis]GBQ63372.1 hypothetical protein AA103196_0573 [Ameyamaea chiangmaiensis NBRC 103196]
MTTSGSDAEGYWLYDWFGRFLDHDPGPDRLVARPCAIARGGRPGLSLVGLSARTAVGDPVRLVKRVTAPMPLPTLCSEASGRGGIALRVTDRDGPFAAFHNRMLTATDDGQVRHRAQAIRGWEMFLPLTPVEAMGLERLMDADTMAVSRPNGEAVVGDRARRQDFTLVVAGRDVPVVPNLDALRQLGALEPGGGVSLTLQTRDSPLRLDAALTDLTNRTNDALSF